MPRLRPASNLRRSALGASRTYSDRGKGRSAEAQHDCLSLDQTKALPVAWWTARETVLLLWATDPSLPRVLHVLKVIKTWASPTSPWLLLGEAEQAPPTTSTFEHHVGAMITVVSDDLLRLQRTATVASQRDPYRRGPPAFPMRSSLCA